RKEFADLYVNYKLNESIQKPFEAFMKGFLRGCPGRMWKVFHPAELQSILQGHAKYDWNLLQKHAKYIRYQNVDRTIRNFWTVFHKLPEEKKKMFLAFLSGCDQISGYGLEHFTFTIEDPKLQNPDDYCPSANTCYRILLLPR
ncbi:HERC3 ligase, partial [Pluvianellus socialis]|nr:HERC3 ligase [Pluvianellus socialis]